MALQGICSMGQVCFRKFLSVMSDVSLISLTTFAIIKESGGWLHLEWILVYTKSIKMNKSHTPSEAFCGGLEFGRLWEQALHLVSPSWFGWSQDNFLA